jgi:hypothetical protein
MDFDTYWKNLIRRVYDEQAVLRGAEERLYRLTCIYGETMVDGLEAYFERRFDEYERDMAALNENGFSDIVADFAEARETMFGDSPLTEDVIEPVLKSLLDEDELLATEMQQIAGIYSRLIERLPAVLDCRDTIGVDNGLFELHAERSGEPQAPITRDLQSKCLSGGPVTAAVRQDMSDGKLIHDIFARPRMFCEDVASYRDILLFAQGVCHGLRPPHGSGTLPGFSDFLARRFGTLALSWPQILQSQFDHLSWQQACESTCELILAWQQENRA